MNISIIIPTYNRASSLKECLACLKRQTLEKSRYEIIVVDDGSSKNMEYLADEVLENSGVKYIFIRQHNSGPAEARNKGIRASRGEIVLFIGDDIMASKNFLSEHYDFHLKNPSDNMAMLGYTTWSKDIKITDFMVWLEKSGTQFGYDYIKPGQAVDYRYFYTSNISLKKIFMAKNGFFNNSFHFAAFEDSELGYRLIKAGLKLIYNPLAIAYHKHEMTIDGYLKRMEIVGRSAKIFAELHPELKKELSLKMRRGLKRSIKSLTAKLVIFFSLYRFFHQLKGYFWDGEIIRSYLRGYDETM